ncbi:hypothetical protein [Emticicia sp. 17c]|uniref:hypothetical protein n=1 Tax=Emticicia sp. 17c TaxID=3127704 RepID=UPI00301CBC3A
MTRKLKNSLLAALAIVGLGIVYYWVRRKRTVSFKDYTPSAEAEAQAAQLRSSLTMLSSSPVYLPALGFIEGSSTTARSSFPVVNVKAPITLPRDEKQIRINQAKALVQQYDTQVSTSARETGVPRYLHYAIILHENPQGIATLDEGNGTGLGAITLVTPTDSIRMAMKKGRLTAKQIAIIQATASQSKNILASSDLGAKLITKSDLKKPDLNVLLIGIQLQNMFHQFGTDKLHQVLFAYNRGISAAKTFLSTNKLTGADASTLIEKSKGLPYYATGSTYVLNQLGVNGILDIIVNEVGITD